MRVANQHDTEGLGKYPKVLREPFISTIALVYMSNCNE